jgi:hypothetical protein
METTAAPTASRKRTKTSTSKQVKELRAAIASIDSLLPTMEKSSKAADLLLERCQLLKSVHALETSDSESESAARIAELENQTTTAAARISLLEQQNAELQRKAVFVDPEFEAQRKAHGYLIDCVTAMATLDHATRLRIFKHVIDESGVPSWKAIEFEKLLGHPRSPSNEPKMASEPTAQPFVPDTRSVEEKLREAKEYGRQAWR